MLDQFVVGEWNSGFSCGRTVTSIPRLLGGRFIKRRDTCIPHVILHSFAESPTIFERSIAVLLDMTPTKVIAPCSLATSCGINKVGRLLRKRASYFLLPEKCYIMAGST